MPINTAILILDRQLPVSLSRQLYHQLRQQILNGEVLYQSRLPATRALASVLCVSRQVVVDSYAALADEGLVVGMGKGGTCVVYQHSRKPVPEKGKLAGKLSRRGEHVASARQYPEGGNNAEWLLTPSQPDRRLFPEQHWRRLHKMAWQSAADWYHYDGGLPLLKQQLLKFLQQYRGIDGISADQLLITTGTQASLSLLTRVLADVGDTALVESPGWGGARAAAHQAELDIARLHIDAEGAVLPIGLTRQPTIAILTPTLQFPSGVIMSATRRQAWLDYAEPTSTAKPLWLIEDDYAAEYCGGQHPPLSLLADGNQQRIIHVGTFAKLLHPGMRVGWMVVPKAIASGMKSALYSTGLQPSYLVQQQLALFMQYGYFAQHLSHARAAYNQRREVCAQWLQSRSNAAYRVQPSASGMNHYLALSPTLISHHGGVEGVAKVLSSAKFGVELYGAEAGKSQVTLLLGHSALEAEELLSALKRLDGLLSL